MNARARTARRIIRSRKSLPTRTQVRRSVVRPHSLTSHLIASGVDTKTATGCVGSLRTLAKRLGVVPTMGRTRRTAAGRTKKENTVHRYSHAQAILLVSAYRPRKAEYMAAAAQFLQAA